MSDTQDTLVERLRKEADPRNLRAVQSRPLLNEAATALADRNAKIAEMERERDDFRSSLQANLDEVTRERDEAVNWTATVERHGTDGFDDLAEAWLSLPAIQRITNAVTSTFSKWANDELMGRFRTHQLSKVECPKCGGTGEMQTELRGFEHCVSCDGSGQTLTSTGSGQGERGEAQASRERENAAFHEWWESSGHAAEPSYSLTTKNACHAAWQARAERAKTGGQDE